MNSRLVSLVGRSLLAVALVVFLGFGLARISFQVDILKLLPQDLVEVEGLGKLMAHFGLPEELILTVETDDPQRTAALADSLANAFRERPDLARMTVARPPWQENPQDLVELLAFAAINAPPEQFAQTAQGLEPDPARAVAEQALEDIGWSLSGEEIARLSYDPFGLLGGFAAAPQGNEPSDFASPDGAFRVIYLQAPEGKSEYLELPGWVDGVWAAALEWRAAQADPESIQLGMTGEPVFVVEISRSMENDMKLSGFCTLLIVALLFYGVYRRLWPLGVMLLMLVGSFAIALGLAGYFVPHLTVLSVGFASILVGLNIDYAMITYNSWIAGAADGRALRREVTPGIAWAAGTTAIAFFSLNISSIPGLAQLGTLVGLGVLAGAVLMVTLFSRAIVRLDPAPSRRLWLDDVVTPRFLRIARVVALVWLVLVAGGLLWRGLPALAHSPAALQPRGSIAYETVDRMNTRLVGSDNGGGPALSLLAVGEDAATVENRLRQAQERLENLEEAGLIADFRLPLELWPSEAYQQSNLPEAGAVAARGPELREILRETGFSEQAFALTGEIFSDWTRWSEVPAADLPVWPEESASRWVLRRVVDRGELQGEIAAQGIVQPAPDLSMDEFAARVPPDLGIPGVYLAGWPLLGEALTDFAVREIGLTLGVFTLILLVMLFLAFRDWRDVLAAAAVLALNALSLLGGMALCGWEWNFFNLGATLLLLGTSIDFSIHLLLGLRRENGDVLAMQRRVGNALMLCGVTTIIGFGSISFAQNQGLASLGQVCALGHLGNTLISVFLLPALRQALGPGATAAESGKSSPVAGSF